MNGHLTRNELLKAIKLPVAKWPGHLAECNECRDAAVLLHSYSLAGVAHLADAPSLFIERAATIPLKKSLFENVKSIVAQLTFDSWTVAHPIGVRGEAATSDRRLRFEAEGIDFDFRAEQLKGGWAFVAQVTGASQSLERVTIQADKRELLPDSGGLFQWTANKPPKKIVLHSDDLVIEVPDLSWKKPNSK